MHSGPFFLASESGGKSVVQQFCDWCNSEAIDSINLKQGIEQLKYETVFSLYDNKHLIELVQKEMHSSWKKWKNEYESLEYQISKCDDTGEGAPALRRLSGQMKRLKENYLLAELSGSGFLPGYGFPTGVVALVTNSKESVDNRKGGANQQSKFKHRGYPSRGLEVALREYAPGAEIVLDSVVYQSQGLQLNWKMPFNENEVVEQQLFRYSWECNDCHTMSTSLLKPDYCTNSECHSQNIKWQEYIVPTGFTVDYSAPLHNDYTQPKYLPYHEPNISLEEAQWQPLPNPSLGRFRVNDNGKLFHYNSGNGAGYALCLCCGRAEILDNNGGISKLVKQHRRLQGTSINNSIYCQGSENSWSIKQSKFGDDNKVTHPFILGYDVKTSIFEIQINDPLTGNPICDSKLMYTLGVALRAILTKKAGITTNELGLAVRDLKQKEGLLTTSLFLFDEASQGAGFSTSILSQFSEVLNEAKKYLSTCTNKNCEGACHACLLDYDTQHEIDNLDRIHINEFFNKTQFVEKLRIPEELRLFGDNTLVEMEPITLLITKVIDTDVTAIRIHLSKDFELWNWPEWKYRNWINQLASSGIAVSIHVDNSITKKIDPELAWAIQKDLVSSISWYENNKTSTVNNGFILFEIIKGSTVQSWATLDKNACLPNDDWSIPINSILVKSPLRSIPADQEKKIDIETIAKTSLLTTAIVMDDVGNKLDYNVQDFGKKLFDFILKSDDTLLSKLSIGIDTAYYYDKFLVSPLSSYLIISFVAEIKKRSNNFPFELYSAYPKTDRYDRKPICVADNWQEKYSQENFFYKLSESFNLMTKAKILEPRDLPHGRFLLLKLNDGSEIKIIFDQGMGYWSTRYPYRFKYFDFDKDEIGQMEEVTKWSFYLKGANHDSYIAIKYD